MCVKIRFSYLDPAVVEEETDEARGVVESAPHYLPHLSLHRIGVAATHRRLHLRGEEDHSDGQSQEN